MIAVMKVLKSPRQFQRIQENWRLCVFIIVILPVGERTHFSRRTVKRYSSQPAEWSLETLKRIFKTTAKGHGEAKQQDLLQGTSTKKDDYSSSKKIKRLTVKGKKIKTVILNSRKAMSECKSHLTHFQLQATVQEAVVDSRLHDL